MAKKFKCNQDTVKKIIAEFTGTFFVMLFGCTANEHASGVTAALAWGLSYMIFIHTFLNISGAHLNPSVSIAATILGMMDWRLMLCYFGGQFGGGLAGWFAGFIMRHGPVEMLFKEGSFFCRQTYGFRAGGAMGIEFLMIFILVLAYCAIWDSRNKGAYDAMSLKIGFIFAACFYGAGGYTNCHLNMARTIPMTLVYLQFKTLWPYLVAHLLGAALAPLLWRFVFQEKKPKPVEPQG